MNRAEKLLASRLLEAAAAKFHEHGCNDPDPAWFERISVTDRLRLLDGFNEWQRAFNPLGFEPYEFHEIGDDQWMSYLAEVLKAGLIA